MANEQPINQILHAAFCDDERSISAVAKACDIPYACLYNWHRGQLRGDDPSLSGRFLDALMREYGLEVVEIVAVSK